MTARLEPLDLASALKSADDIRLFLSEAMQMQDAAYFAHVLSIVARSEGLCQVAEKMHLPADALRQSLAKSENPDFLTVWTMLAVLGFRLDAAPLRPADTTPDQRKSRA